MSSAYLANFVPALTTLRLAGPGSDAYMAFPSTVRTEAGTILAVWRNAAVHVETPNGFIQGRRSTDEGVTWTPATTLFDTVGKDDLIADLTAFEDGTVGMLVLTRDGGDTSNIVNKYLVSEDDGKTWGLRSVVPFSPTEWSFASGLVHVPDPKSFGPGVLLALGYGMDTTSSTYHYAVASRSEDGGRTWQTLPTIRRGPNRHFHEPRAVVAPDGQIVCVLRSDVSGDSALYLTRSRDLGNTWTAPKRIISDDLQGEVASGMPALTLTPEGLLLLCWRAVARNWAWRYALSRDLGRTWEMRGNPIPGGGGRMTYGSWAQLSDGDQMLVYAEEPGDTVGSDVYCMRFELRRV